MSKNAKSGLVWLVIIAIIAFAAWNMIVSKEIVYALAASDFYSLIQQKDSRNLFDVTYKIKIGKEAIEGKFRNVAEIIDRVGNQSPEILNIGDTWQGKFKTSRDMFSNYPLQEKLIEYGIPFDNEPSSNFPQWLVIFGTTILPIVLFIGIMVFISRQMQGAGNRAMSFGKSRARLHSESQTKKTFDEEGNGKEQRERSLA